MVTFLPSRPGRLADVPSFARAIGGAESNVACALAAAGHRAKWVSRVGADGFGDHLVAAVGAYGVDVSAVGRDTARPTGIYFRTATDRATAAHEVAYYRAGSAASAMSPATVPYASVADGRVLHLSGITAALSDDCLALARELTAPRAGRPAVSFDVNFRPGLWRDPAAGGRILLDLARGADLVFVGEDEAEEAWGVHGPHAVRAILPEPAVLVVKRGGAGAVVFEHGPAEAGDVSQHAPAAPGDVFQHAPAAPGGRGARTGPDRSPGPAAAAAPAPPVDVVTSVPAPRVDVVAAVGAGDAFAAGFLSATLRGLDVTARIRHGHLMAAAALTVPGDLGTPATPAHADRLAGLDDGAWERLHLGPGWTGEDQEVRTP
ncbi:PfkB family carbohydrate kinase [Streptomyces sp. NPDC008121]|uniref:sugar kinase n=1 Tax=Streptomyces sp. NPDC008121 TaxID=3364809 RepID=UPI0036E3A4A4